MGSLHQRKNILLEWEKQNKNMEEITVSITKTEHYGGMDMSGKKMAQENLNCYHQKEKETGHR